MGGSVGSGETGPGGSSLLTGRPSLPVSSSGVGPPLQSGGIRCWLDERQLLPGDDIYDMVDRGIRLWDKVLLCCSEAFDGGIVGFCLTEEPAEVETETPAPAKPAPAKKTGGRRKARAAS